MQESVITPKRLTDMQDMEVYVNGPDGANRMYIHSGMAEVEIHGGVPHPRWSLEVVCFEIGRSYDVANEAVIKIVASASLAGGRTDGMASFAGWQIFGAAGELDDDSHRVRMNIAAGARDTQAVLEQIAFQITVLSRVKE